MSDVTQHRHVLTYDYPASNQSHERWLTEWAVKWFECDPVRQLNVNRTERDGAVHVEITVSVGGSPDDWLECSRILLAQLDAQVAALDIEGTC